MTSFFALLLIYDKLACTVYTFCSYSFNEIKSLFLAIELDIPNDLFKKKSSCSYISKKSISNR